MSNITTARADTAGFIPQAWAQMGLDVLRANIVLAKLVTRDSDIEPGWKGKQLNIPYPGTFTAQDKAADGTANVQIPSGGASVPVTLTKHKYVDFIVEDVAQAQSNTDIMERYVKPAVIALAEQLETDLWTTAVTLTGTVGTYGTDLSAAAMRSAKKALTDNKIAQSPRYLVMSTKDEIALLADTTLATYFAYAKSQAITDGAVARIYGFDLFVSQLVPTVAGTPLQTQNVAFNPEALILATRPFRDPPANSGVQVSQIVDPVSGLVIRVIYFYDVNYRGVRVGFDILYGAAKLRDSAGILVKS